MNRFLKTLTGAFCTVSILLSGVTVFALDNRKTPSGIGYDYVGYTIENWAKENPDSYVSFVTAVFDKEEVLYTGAFGEVDRENKVECTTDSVFEWGSVTKLTVWVSVMQLYEQGRIDLNADVRGYLPDGFLQKLKYDDHVTMLKIMKHDAGGGEYNWNLIV